MMRRHWRHIITPALRARVLKRDGHRCRWCGATSLLEMDHVIPVEHGGETTEANLQTLCRGCNHRKGATLHCIVLPLNYDEDDPANVLTCDPIVASAWGEIVV